jgi:hypothetical protein
MINNCSLFMQKTLLALTIALCATGMNAPIFATRAMADSMPPESSVTTPASLPAYLETLLEATTFDDSAVGVAAVKTATYQAFEQAIEAGDRIRPEIEYVLQQGTPAGRLYAALLLLHFDRESGKQALEQLRSEEVMVTRFSGCSPSTMSMSQAVAEISSEQGVELSIE